MSRSYRKAIPSATACGLLGPRQVGKTTLANQFMHMYEQSHGPKTVLRLDLENSMDLARFENP
ncbi:MAG: hypothetical protein FJZ58_05380 [Chlamydiae bacterium]|nr:hypothetical protein [Chlamydiota bacterium]